MRSIGKAIALLVLAFVLASCLDSYRPDVGPPVREICVDQDSDPAETVSFADIQAMILDADRPTRCLNCHDPAAETPIGVEIGGLVLVDWDSLIEGGVNSGAEIVVPGKPCESVLYQKLTAGPPFGSRMPFNGPPFLTDDELQLVHDWIAEGASSN